MVVFRQLDKKIGGSIHNKILVRSSKHDICTVSEKGKEINIITQKNCIMFSNLAEGKTAHNTGGKSTRDGCTGDHQ